MVFACEEDCFSQICDEIIVWFEIPSEHFLGNMDKARFGKPLWRPDEGDIVPELWFICSYDLDDGW
jgi:hypothetical protein